MATDGNKTWIQYKNNQYLLIGAGAVFAFTGFLIYVKSNQNLYQAMLDKIKKPVNKVASGVHGDWHDVYDGDFWNPKTYLVRNDIEKPTIDRITASNYAKAIYDSIGVTDMTSHQSEGVAIFKKMSNLADVAVLADRFSSIYNRLLTDYLKSHYEGALTHKNYMEDIYNILQGLPA